MNLVNVYGEVLNEEPVVLLYCRIEGLETLIGFQADREDRYVFSVLHPNLFEIRNLDGTVPDLEDVKRDTSEYFEKSFIISPEGESWKTI